MKNRNNTRERARQVGWIVVAAFLLWGVCDCRGDAEKPKSFLDAQAILDAWQRNYTGIVSQKLRLSSRVVKGGDPCEIQYYCIERTDDGSRFHVWQTTSPLGFEEKERVVVTSFDGRVSKECLYSQRGPIGYITPGRIGTLAATDNPLAIILGTKRDDLDPNSELPSSRGQRFIEALRKEYPNGIPSLMYTFRNAREFGRVTVRPKLESVAGVLCHVVEIDYPGSNSRMTMWFAHEKSMLRMKGLSEHPDVISVSTEVSEITSVQTEKGVLWYPRKTTQERKTNDAATTYEVEVQEFVPHIKVPDSTFDIAFPPGTSVHDSVTHRMYYAGDDVSQN